MRNLSYENEYDLHSNGLVSKTHFHMKGFALGLVLKQRQKRTRKWPISQPRFTFKVQAGKCYHKQNPRAAKMKRISTGMSMHVPEDGNNLV